MTILERIRDTARRRILLLPHALDAMNAPDELITVDEVRATIFHGEIIEDYPEDVRGHSCLMLGFGEGERTIHVVCSPKDEYLVIITVYIPSSLKWHSDWRTRSTNR